MELGERREGKSSRFPTFQINWRPWFHDRTSHTASVNTDLVRSYIVQIAQWVVELSLHDSEVLVQLVHDVTAVLVKMTTVGLFPCAALDQKGVLQRFGDQQNRTNAVRLCKICDLVFEHLHMSSSDSPDLPPRASCECKAPQGAIIFDVVIWDARRQLCQ